MKMSHSHPSAQIQIAWALVLTLTLVAGAQARPRSAQEVEAAVLTWLNVVVADSRPQASVLEMEPVKQQGETVAYLAHLRIEGYCLTGADDLNRPVIFYAPEGTYDPTNPSLQYMISEIVTNLNGAREALATSPNVLAKERSERALLWDDLVAGRKPSISGMDFPRNIPDYLVLNRNTEWSQGSPYNDQCPVPIGPPNDGVPSLVGCQALSMTQIMYYWKWPNWGNNSLDVLWPLFTFGEFDSVPLANDPGIDSSRWAGRLEWDGTANPPELKLGGTWDHSMLPKARKISNDPEFQTALTNLYGSSPPLTFQAVSADFSSTNYSWDLIQPEHTDADGLDEGDAEIAQICFQASVALRMNWGRYASDSEAGAGGAFSSYFQYDPDAIWDNRDIGTMVHEIAWGRPLMLLGFNGEGGGHAWTVLGYDTTAGLPNFLMNLGWGMNTTGWYYVNDDNLDFTEGQSHFTLIAPRDNTRFVGNELPFGDGTPGSPYWNLAAAMNDAPVASTLILKAGSDNKVSGSAAIMDSQHIIKAMGAVISHE